jgi:hypothetical protein
MTTRKTFSARGACLLIILAVGLAIYAHGRRPARAHYFELPGEAPDAMVVAQEQSKGRVEAELKERQLKAAGSATVESIGSVIEHPFAGATIKGAPFSAQVVVEGSQTLASGLHISRKVTGAVYRDSEGRTRQEMPREGAAEIVLINDPSAGVFSKLHMFQHTVRKISYSTESQANREREEREIAEKKAMESAKRSAGSATAPQKKSESLGTQLVEGVQAQGMRFTITIAAGSEGNDQPFDIVTEKWYSPDLQQVVMIRRSDPRTGDTLYRLTGISRSEPDRSLFEAPAGFTVVEEGKSAEGRTEAKQK